MKPKKSTLIILVVCISYFSCGENCTEKSWYRDADGDGFGDPLNSTLACDQPSGFVSDNTDFDDANASANPGASEICNDGIDNDGNGFIDCEDLGCQSSNLIECNCSDDLDNDGDGFVDCDDFDCEGNPAC
ncbi:MopE-related protein [Algoriphagus hitonicola]|uniref:Thrombospondin type 3 repeat-containing protein n=1 Tax=Algoriphagus hitonicola TaxID=435880 RepID=A0A1I2R6U8_9BACT|nr:hypothetical protein [Algoriphagus hitonicola]SFG36140.1 hypothetical protein SAMN04487988_10394 [Algoriphagus hitonicola]